MKYPTKWDFSPLYKGDSDPKIKKDLESFQKAHRKFVKKWQNRDDYLTKPVVLKKALTDYFNLMKTAKGGYDYGYYLFLRQSQEEDNPKLKALANKFNDITVKIGNEMQFFSMRLSKVNSKTQKLFLSAPGLAPYNKYLKDLFSEAKHLLSEPEEKIMNLKADVSHGRWTDMVSTLLAKQTREVYGQDGKKTVKSFGEIIQLNQHKSKKVRDSAFRAANEILEKYAEVAEAEINAILANKKVNDELRGWPRPDSSRHFADDMETHVVDALAEAVEANFKIAQRFYKFKAKLLKQKQLAYNERLVPYGKTDFNYNYEEGVKLVEKTFSKLDDELNQIYMGFVKNGQIDAFPKKGKTGGAFCASNTSLQPTYILLNHTNTLRDVLTLAHEAGHGINNELIKKDQPSWYFGTPLSTAEVASTFMEDFVLEEVLSQSDQEAELSIRMMKLSDDISTIFRQIAGYRFEQDLHNSYRAQGYLPAGEIGKIFKKHMVSYMGPAVKQEDGTENWWVYWSHFRSFFYVYSYASGLLISKAMQRKTRQNPEFINEVKEFLAAGTSKTPKEIFQKMGIDISQKKFWQDGIKEIDEFLTDTEKLAKKLGKL